MGVFIKILAIVLTLVNLSYAVLGFLLIPKFKESLKQTGGDIDLSFTTKFVFETYYYLIVIAFIPILSYILLKNNEKILLVVLYFFLAFTILFVPIIVWQMLIPLITFSNIIG